MTNRILPLLITTLASLFIPNVDAEVPTLIIKTTDGQIFQQDGIEQTLKPFEIGPFNGEEWDLLATADLDNDRILDYLLKHKQSNELVVQPNPLLSERKAYPLPFDFESQHQVKTGDVDGDGTQDLVIYDQKRNAIFALIEFHQTPRLIELLYPKDTVSDLMPNQIDGDGKLDFIHLTDREVVLHLTQNRSTSHREQQAFYRFNVQMKNDGSLFNPTFVDLNNDSKKDVVFETQRGELAAYQLFSGSDGYIGLAKLGQPLRLDSEQETIGSFDIDDDGLSEWVTRDLKDNTIRFYQSKESTWQQVYQFPLRLDPKLTADIELVPIWDLPIVFANYVGVDQINEYVSIFISPIKTSLYRSPSLSLEVLEPSDSIISALAPHYRADFGVDVTSNQFAFSATANVYPTSASFVKLEPNANGILQPIGASTPATIVGKKISATLDKGHYRLRVKNQSSLSNLVTLSRYVSHSVQQEVSRLYPFVIDPDTDASRDHYLTRRLSVVTDADDYYDRVAFFKDGLPNGTTPNFSHWFDYNDITDKTVMNAVYINSGDLGFARNMFITKKDSDKRVFAWVENYETLPEAVAASKSYKSFHDTFEPSPFGVFGVIELIPYFSYELDYISILDAVRVDLRVPISIADLLKPKGVQRKGLIATVVMEYHYPDSEHGRLVSFMVFNENGELSTLANLDGRGAKQNPGVCMSCHGGGYSMADNGDVGAGFVPWDLDSYIYSTDSDYTRNAQLNNFWGMNKEVKKMYSNTDPIYQLVDDWYPNVFPADEKVFEGDNVMPSDFASNGKQVLYRQVAATSCRMCHVQPGIYNAIAEDAGAFVSGINAKLEHTLDKDDLNRYAPEMPHAYLTFKNLWSRGYMDAVKAEIGH